MSRPPISFRLSDREWEILEKARSPQESINQAAARLLREKLGILTVDSEYTLESTTLENWITDSINSKLGTVYTALEDMIADETKKLRDRVDSIESKLPKPRTRKKVSE